MTVQKFSTARVESDLAFHQLREKRDLTTVNLAAGDLLSMSPLLRGRRALRAAVQVVSPWLLLLNEQIMSRRVSSPFEDEGEESRERVTIIQVTADDLLSVDTS